MTNLANDKFNNLKCKISITDKKNQQTTKFMQKSNWTKYFKEFIPLIYENVLQIKK